MACPTIGEFVAMMLLLSSQIRQPKSAGAARCLLGQVMNIIELNIDAIASSDPTVIDGAERKRKDPQLSEHRAKLVREGRLEELARIIADGKCFQKIDDAKAVLSP